VLIGRWWQCGPPWGQPGGSAQATWRRARAAEWATWTRTLPWRLALTLGIAAGGGVLSSLLAPRLSLVVGAVVGMAAGWGLRFKPSPDAVDWRPGAAGERRTARLLSSLERQGWAVLHDLAVPGSRANLGARVPWGKVVSDGVPVLAATHMPGLLRALPAVLGPERVAAVASQARIHFRSAA
jgi:hypothetical protein